MNRQHSHKISPWRTVMLPLRLLLQLIWQPSQITSLSPNSFILHPFTLLVLLCSIPLLIGVVQIGAAFGGFVVLAAWLVALSCVWSRQALLGIEVLLLGGTVALVRPSRLTEGIATTFRIPSGGQLLGMLVVCGILLAFGGGIGALLGRLRWHWPAYVWATCIGIVIALLALIIAGQQPLGTLAVLLFGLALLPLVFGAVEGTLFSAALLAFIFGAFGAITVESRVLVPFAGGLSFWLALIINPVLQFAAAQSVGHTPRDVTLGVIRRASAPLIAVLVIVVGVLGSVLVAGVSVLPAPVFLVICWLCGLLGFDGLEGDWKNMLLLLLVPAIGVETQALPVVGGAMLAVLIGGYRLLPEYPIFAVLSLLGERARAQEAARWLRRLPPMSSEHLWVPLPGHAAVLRTALEAGSLVAFATLERMRVSPYLVFHRTVLAAVLPLVRPQLIQLQTPQAIAALADADQPPLTRLIGALITAAAQLRIGHNANEPVTRISLRPSVAPPWQRRLTAKEAPLIADIQIAHIGLLKIAHIVALALAPMPEVDDFIAFSTYHAQEQFSPQELINQYAQRGASRPTIADACAALDVLATALGTADDAGAAARWHPVIAHWRAVLHAG